MGINIFCNTTQTSSSEIFVTQNDGMIFNLKKSNDKNQACNFIDYLEEVFEKCNIGYCDINRFYFICGPGSLTGIKIGIAISEAINLCMPEKAINVDKFYLIALCFNYQEIAIKSDSGYFLMDENKKTRFIKKNQSLNDLSYEIVDFDQKFSDIVEKIIQEKIQLENRSPLYISSILQ